MVQVILLIIRTGLIVRTGLIDRAWKVSAMAPDQQDFEMERNFIDREPNRCRFAR